VLLSSANPKAIGFEGAVGVIAQFNGAFQVAEFPLPGGSVLSGTANRERLGCRRGARRCRAGAWEWTNGARLRTRETGTRQLKIKLIVRGVAALQGVAPMASETERTRGL
jgi:hypothetical protein